MKALATQALSGDENAFNQLGLINPKMAEFVQGQIQQRATQEQVLLDERSMETAGFIEQMHLAPQEQQQAMFDAAVDDPRYDIDEEDRGLFMDTNARKAIIGQVKGKEYADSFFWW